MKYAIKLIGLVLVLSGMMCAADIAGTWKGAFDFNGTNVPVVLTLKAAAEGAVAGTIEGLPTPTTDIHEGKLAGDVFTFWVMTDYQGTPYKLVYRGKLSGDQIVFDFGTEDGSWGSQLIVKRGS